MANSFTPTLGRIIEETIDRTLLEESFDEDILDEYEVLTENDLLVALELDPKKGKSYLSGVGYKDDDDSDEYDDSDDDSHEIIDAGMVKQNECCQNGVSSDFESLHHGTKEKNQKIIGKFSFKPDLDMNRRSSYLSETDSADYRNGGDNLSIISGSASQYKMSKQRKTSEQSSYSLMKNGEELLRIFLENHTGYEFDSKEGKKIFVKSILKKYMNMYYIISPPQVTSGEYDASGISTLLAIRNALKIKDNKMLHDNASMNGGDTASIITSCVMFDCPNNTIDFDEFACIARLNDLSVEAILITKESDIKAFRKDVKLSCQSDSKICVCYYSCNELYQSAGSYFALVGGYFKEKDMVLLFDASRNKIPPYWIPLPVLWKALQSKKVDATTFTDSKLGYFLVEKADRNPYIVLNVSGKVSIMLGSHVQNHERLFLLKEHWDKWLVSPSNGSESILHGGIRQIMEIIKTQTFKQTLVNDERAKLTYKQGSLVDSLTKTKTFPIVEKFIASLNKEHLSKLTVFAEWVLETIFITRKSRKDKSKFHHAKKRKKKLVKTNVNMNTFNNTAMLTTWLLFWPYQWRNLDSNCSALSESIQKDLDTFSPFLVNSFHEQINFIVKVIQSSAYNTLKNRN